MDLTGVPSISRAEEEEGKELTVFAGRGEDPRTVNVVTILPSEAKPMRIKMQRGTY